MRLPAGERVGEEHAGPLGSVLGERRVEVLHGEPDLEMGDDEGRGHDLEAEHAFGRRLFHPRTGQRPEALAFEIGGDAAQHLRQIGPGAGARVEHVDVLRRQPFGDAEVVLKRLVHPGDHVADDLRRRVPDAELLAEVRVEGLEEGFVEIGHRLALGEAGEEGGTVHPVERGGGPVQHLDEAERLQPAGVGELLEQRPKHRRAQMPDRVMPVEFPRRRRGLPRPQHPGREHAVEQGLHQRRMEEARAPVALEADAERLLQRRTHRPQRGRVARRLDPREAVAGVGSEQPREVLRLGQRGTVRQRAGEIFAEPGADIPGEGAGRPDPAPELLRAAGQPEGFEPRRAARLD